MNNGIPIRKLKKTAPDMPRQKDKPASWLTRDITLFSIFGDKHKEAFYHEFGTLLQAGVDLKAALDIIIGQQQGDKQATMLRQLQQAVVQGSALSTAMQRHTPFTPYEYYSVQIGEETGKIAAVLQDLAAFFRKRLQQRRQLTSALTYPVIVMLTSFGAIFFMLNFIVPLFADIFARSGSALPPITQLIVSFSEASRTYAPLAAVAAIALGGWLYARRDKEWNRRWTAWFWLHLPVFGPMVRKVYLARFCTSMALLTGARIPLIRALQLCRQMVGFYPIEQSLIAVEASVMHGHTLHSSLAAFPLYDAKLVSLVKVGEEVNRLADFFNKVADQYNEEVAYQSATIASLLEPLIIIFLGLLVGVILIAMYLPMFQMGDIIG
ncbi:type II secretion system F family protein [Parapedobacter sp. 10938]|uniref:type II secretion system F family protein n=1 Tax=Parapedobacter flavus TaxID=3110225 RepID=UPI002DC05994|nr:type II secretion system F family protein [Parapedobacter sp. 10938]MEC3878629.1 type II secretion system F family protein [Parapedobacter sp. 10938]